MYHFHDYANYAYYSMVNPLVICVVGVFLPFLPFYHRVSTPKWIMLGTMLQFISPLWPWISPQAEWPFIPMNIQFAIGEVMAFPLIDEYANRVSPEGETALYMSMQPTPLLFGRLLGYAISTQLLHGFCADPVTCFLPTTSPLWIWIISSAIAALTPVIFFILWRCKIVLDER